TARLAPCRCDHECEPDEWRSLLAFFSLLEHVLDAGLVNEHVGLAVTAEFDAGLVVPLDDSLDGFAVLQDHHHRSAGLHLLLVIKILRVGLFRRRILPAVVYAFAPLRRRFGAVLARKRRADQLAVGEPFR